MSMPLELYACLYVKEFPAQSLLRLRPEMQSKACIIMEGESPAGQVCSLNTKARLLGIHHGMTQVEVSTFPEVVVLPRSARSEAATKLVLLECAGTFSPRIEDRSEATTLICCIDIAGTKSLFGPPVQLAQTLLQHVTSLGIFASIIISSNFHAAVCLARGLSNRTRFHVIPEGEETATLSPLPLSVLSLTEMQAETFALWGIHTLGMLAALPEHELTARMGQDSKRLQQLARGQWPHLFQPVEPVFTLKELMELDAPLDDLESLLFGVSVMLDQLILRAKARILALASLTITLSLDGGGTHVRTIRQALPSMDKQLWIKLLHLDLDAHPPHAGIMAVGLHAEAGEISKIQFGLFSPQLPEAARLDISLARIRAIVGDDCVGSAVLQDTHAVEAFCIQPFAVPSGTSKITTSTQARASIRLLRPPQIVAITLHNAMPVHFYFHEKRYTVEHAYGPWSATGDWWKPALWEFEQWDLAARTQDGTPLFCCIMRDLLRNHWQMVGLYD